MIKTDPYSYWPKEKVCKILTYDLKPIIDLRDIYASAFILKEQPTPVDFKEVANNIDFRFNTCFGWGGFYPNPQVYSNDRKIIPYKFQSGTHYKIWLGGLYEYNGEFYGYDYFT